MKHDPQASTINTPAAAGPASGIQRYVDAVKALQLDLDEKFQRTREGNTAKFDSESAGRLTEEARALLVVTSEQNGAAPKKSPQHKVASHVAAGLGALDYPKNANPFKTNNALAKLYDREQVNREISRHFGNKDPEKAWGLERSLAEQMRPGTAQLDAASAREDQLAWQKPENRPQQAAHDRQQPPQDIER